MDKPQEQKKTERRGMNFVKVSDSPDLLVDGLIPGVDIPGKFKGNRFYPDAPLSDDDERGGLPWYIVATFDDLDRTAGAKYGKIVLLKQQRERITAEIKRLEDWLHRHANYYADLVPAPEGDGVRKTTKGAWTGISYTNEPDRQGVYELRDEDEARKAGLMRWTNPQPKEEPLSNTALHKYEKENNKKPPGFEYVPQMPVAIKLPDWKNKGQEDAE